MKIIYRPLILALITFNVCATTSTTTLNTKGHDTSAEKLDLEFVYALEQTKESSSHQTNGSYSSLKTSLLYSLTSVDDFRLYNSFVYENYNKMEDQKYFEFLEFMYRRKNILSEDEHGIVFNLELKYGSVIDREIKKRWGFDSEFIPQLILKKRFAYGQAIDLKLRHHFYDRNRKTAGTITNEDRVYLSYSKMFKYGIITNSELKYRHKKYTGKHYSYYRSGMQNKNVEDLTLHQSLLYLFNKKHMLELYFETKLNDTYDERPIKELAQNELIFGTAIYLTAF